MAYESDRDFGVNISCRSARCQLELTFFRVLLTTTPPSRRLVILPRYANWYQLLRIWGKVAVSTAYTRLANRIQSEFVQLLFARETKKKKKNDKKVAERKLNLLLVI